VTVNARYRAYPQGYQGRSGSRLSGIVKRSTLPQVIRTPRRRGLRHSRPRHRVHRRLHRRLLQLRPTPLAHRLRQSDWIWIKISNQGSCGI